MKRMRRMSVALGLAVALVAGGCSDDESPTGATGPGEAEDSSGTANGDSGESDGEGTGETGAAGAADMAVPLPPGADAVGTTESGPATIVQFIVPLDRQAETIAFYEDWTSSQSDAYQRTEVDTGGVSWQNNPASGADNVIIAVLSPLEGDDFIVVTVTTGLFE